VKGVDAIARLLKVEGAEFLSVYPTMSLIAAGRCGCLSRWGSSDPARLGELLSDRELGPELGVREELGREGGAAPLRDLAAEQPSRIFGCGDAP